MPPALTIDTSAEAEGEGVGKGAGGGDDTAKGIVGVGGGGGAGFGYVPDDVAVVVVAGEIAKTHCNSINNSPVAFCSMSLFP